MSALQEALKIEVGRVAKALEEWQKEEERRIEIEVIGLAHETESNPL